MVTAIASIASNNKRLPEYIEAFNNDKAEFVKSEKERVEDFQYLYRMTIIIASVCFVVHTDKLKPDSGFNLQANLLPGNSMAMA